MHSLLLLSLALLLTGDVTAEWRDAPYGDESFNTRARYTDDIALHCNDSRVAAVDYNVTKWILPNLDIMYAGDETCFNTLDGWACWAVTDDGMDIDITLVQDEHFGFYYCEVEEEGTGAEYVVKRALNYKGPDYGGTWPKYEKATIWSVTSSIIFGIVCGILGVVYIKMYPDSVEEEEEGNKEGERSREGSITKETYRNVAFDAETGVNVEMDSTSGAASEGSTTPDDRQEIESDDVSVTRM